MSDIWLLLIFVIPVVLITLLRTNGVFVYLGLCLGYVLSEFDGNSKTVTYIPNYSKVIHHLGGANDLRLLLLVLPPLIILVLMIKTFHKSKLLSTNLIAAIAVGILAVMTVIPLLPLGTAVSILDSSLWSNISKYQSSLVGISALVTLVLLVLQRSKLKPPPKESKHHKSKG